jgi:hypothetical protein
MVFLLQRLGRSRSSVDSDARDGKDAVRQWLELASPFKVGAKPPAVVPRRFF